jgi:lipopolysaccharide/colanic/teichoic acid biosynthesis glycosyltransferase
LQAIANSKLATNQLKALVDAMIQESSKLAILERQLVAGPGKTAALNCWRRLAKRQAIRGGIAKRALDISVATLVLALFLPFGLVLALLIKRDGGSVFYWQTRVGFQGRSFRFPKFRSMVANADALRATLLNANDHGGSGITFKREDDPRITAVGRFLRRSSLDELPQLWCVIKGDMSLVGPRPALPEEVARYSALQRRRLEAQPGLTCIWQVSGRSQIPFEGQVALDLEYIRTRSFRTDFVLLLKTIPAVLFGRGAS